MSNQNEILLLFEKTQKLVEENNHEFFTPEHFLYTIINDFEHGVIEQAGGDTESIKKDLKNYINKIPIAKNSVGFLTVAMKDILKNYEKRSISTEQANLNDMIFEIFKNENTYASFYMKSHGVTEQALMNAVAHPDIKKKDENGKPLSNLEEYAINMTEMAKNGKYDNLIGREIEINRTIEILCRKKKNNPIYVGKPGVGKTAITEGIALQIANETINDILKGYEIYSLDMGSLLAGTQFRGQFEERLKNTFKELQEKNNVILFIDEIHMLIGAGATQNGTMDAANILKPLLTSGEIRVIGATTYDEYKKHFQKDAALSRRFQQVDVVEPTIEDTIAILKGLKPAYEKYHGVTYTDKAIESIVNLTSQYMNDKYQPDKSIDIMDESGSKLKIANFGKNKKNLIVDEENIEKIIAITAKIPEKTVSSDEGNKLKEIDTDIKTKLFGQDEAVNMVVKAVRKSRAGFNKANKPIASFLFVGPTGVGKTELAKQLATNLGVKLERFDMSEYQEKHSVARLIGAPPGYVGYEEGGLLVDAIKNTPNCVLLLDEIEKAHGDIFNTLLQIMDNAEITDTQGRKADFKNAIIIMTSNAGAKNITKRDIGFGAESINISAMDDEVKNVFAPEFRNRLDAVIKFNHLSKEISFNIVKKEINEFRDMLKEKNVSIIVKNSVIDFIIDKGYSQEFGARNIARTVDKYIKDIFIEEVLYGKLSSGGKATLSIKDDNIKMTIHK